MQQNPLGQATYSAVYDLDVSELKEYASSTECPVAQLLNPGEADRFAIVVSAPTLGEAGGWRLTTLFKTNVGATSGPEVELWLSRPATLHPFSAVKQNVVSQAEKLTKLYGAEALVAESEPGRSAGYKTVIIVDISITTYYGPQPLITIPGAISVFELFLRERAADDPTYAKSQEMLIDILPRDLDLAFTMLQTADLAAVSDPERCQAGLAKARKSLDTIRRYESCILDLEIWNSIHNRADELEAALSAWERPTH